jgi:four helix bundle protein
MQDYHQLEIWRRGMDYAVNICAFTRRLPSEERFNLIAQLRSAATSVPFNAAEGSGCTTNPEFARFLSYAYRS